MNAADLQHPAGWGDAPWRALQEVEPRPVAQPVEDQRLMAVLAVLARYGIELQDDKMQSLAADLVAALGDTSKSAPWKPAKGYAKRKLVAKKNPIPGWRLCATCDETKPIGEFTIVNDKKRPRPQVRSSCKVCLADKQRNRYVSVKLLHALNTLRIEFVADDEIVGLRCLDCHEVIVAGDEVVAESGLRHTYCADESDERVAS